VTADVSRDRYASMDDFFPRIVDFFGRYAEKTEAGGAALHH
jgi:hypothetical protein